MKVLWPAIVLVIFAATLGAQNNSPPPVQLGSASTVITNDTVEFDLKTRVAVYRGNVRVEAPGMVLTCDLMTAKVPESGGRIESIVAEHNVVIDATDEKGRVTHGTCDKLVYTYTVVGSVTNETVVLTGHPLLKNPMGNLTGDPIIWDKANGRVSANNEKMELRGGGTPSIPSLLKQAGDAKK